VLGLLEGLECHDPVRGQGHGGEREAGASEAAWRERKEWRPSRLVVLLPNRPGRILGCGGVVTLGKRRSPSCSLRERAAVAACRSFLWKRSFRGVHFYSVHRGESANERVSLAHVGGCAVIGGLASARFAGPWESYVLNGSPRVHSCK